MSEGIKLIRKIVRVREYLIREGKSMAPKGEIIKHLKTLKSWSDFYPSAPDPGVRKFMRSHLDAIHAVIPGVGAPNHEAYKREIDLFLNGE